DRRTGRLKLAAEPGAGLGRARSHARHVRRTTGPDLPKLGASAAWNLRTALRRYGDGALVSKD
ncbi:MAG TPA: hypothetical protein VGG68_01780, partial [Caulobacteraceae bacterium]